MLRVLFVGESWLGSCARSLKEALARHPAVVLDEVNEDLSIPRPRARWLRAAGRLLRRGYQQELLGAILHRVRHSRPDVVIVYKGTHVGKAFVRCLRAHGCAVVNVYPDNSPHAHGPVLKGSVGEYDLVISTKPFHPTLWADVYGYRNRCVFVPQGYDPLLHLMTEPSSDTRFDVVLVATWRPEYGELMKRLGRLLSGRPISVAIGGTGWREHEPGLPGDWTFLGGLQGRAYVEALRQGRICLAPLTRDVVVSGKRQPGDEDTTRTYELAAAHCFFIHRRTDYVTSLYDEATEVPMYETPEELAEKILHFLSNPQVRAQMAAAAHRRAVPEFGLDRRANDIVEVLSELSERTVGLQPDAESLAPGAPV